MQTIISAVEVNSSPGQRFPRSGKTGGTYTQLEEELDEESMRDIPEEVLSKSKPKTRWQEMKRTFSKKKTEFSKSGWRGKSREGATKEKQWLSGGGGE